MLAARRNFLEFDPPKHGRYRRLISTQFTPGAVARYEEWLRELVRYRLDAVLAQGEFDLVHELAAPIPIRVLAHILGLPEEILPHLIDLGDRLLVDTDPEYVGEHAYAGEREEYRYKPFGSPWADELCAIGREFYADRRACPRDDVLSLIANGEIDGQPLSDQDLDNTFALLIVAGNETTRQAISLGTLALAEHPDEYERLRADRSLIPSATEELLRFSSPVWFFRRTATRDVTVRDVEIAAGRQGDRVVRRRQPRPRPLPRPAPARRRPQPDRPPDVRPRRAAPVPGGSSRAGSSCACIWRSWSTRVERIELAGEPVRQRTNFTNGLKRLPVRVTLA